MRLNAYFVSLHITDAEYFGITLAHVPFQMFIAVWFPLFKNISLLEKSGTSPYWVAMQFYLIINWSTSLQAVSFHTPLGSTLMCATTSGAGLLISDLSPPSDWGQVTQLLYARDSKLQMGKLITVNEESAHH